jgi:hypothetical protein
MRQRELFEATSLSRTAIPTAIETELVALLTQLMLSTFNHAAVTDEEDNDEPDQR